MDLQESTIFQSKKSGTHKLRKLCNELSSRPQTKNRNEGPSGFQNQDFLELAPQIKYVSLNQEWKSSNTPFLGGSAQIPRRGK